MTTRKLRTEIEKPRKFKEQDKTFKKRDSKIQQKAVTMVSKFKVKWRKKSKEDFKNYQNLGQLIRLM